MLISNLDWSDFMIDKKTLIFCIFFISFTSLFSLSLYPVSFDKDIQFGATEEYTFFNTQNKTIVYKVNINMNKFHISTLVFPKIFVLNPGESKSVKIFLKPITKLNQGVYSGFIDIETLPLNLEESGNIKLNVILNISPFVYNNF